MINQDKGKISIAQAQPILIRLLRNTHHLLSHIHTYTFSFPFFFSSFSIPPCQRVIFRLFLERTEGLNDSKEK